MVINNKFKVESFNKNDISIMEYLLTKLAKKNKEFNDMRKNRAWNGATPLEYSRKFTRVAHFNVVKDLIKYVESQYLGKMDIATRNKHIQKANEFLYPVAREFYELMPDKIEDRLKVKVDKNNEFIEFVDKYKSSFDKLEKVEQVLATLHFLAGTVKLNNTFRRNVIKLLPIDLMNDETIKKYSELLNEKILKMIDKYKIISRIEKKPKVQEMSREYEKTKFMEVMFKSSQKINKESIREC